MGVPGALQVTLRAPRAGSTVETWSLPAFAVPMRSLSILMGTGHDLDSGGRPDLVIIRPRIADALGIRIGDEVDFTFEEFGETFRLRVDNIKDGINTDVLIHDLQFLGILGTVSITGRVTTVDFNSSDGSRAPRQTILPNQEMWAGLRPVEKKGSALLFFDGASRNNPKGPAGYGFHIVQGDLGDFKAGAADELVRGNGYAGMNRSNNEMEYEGLIDGLNWAMRLDLKSLTICGDSLLIIKQVDGEYSVRNHRLRALLAKVKALLQKDSNLEWSLCHTPREANSIADGLANLAIDTRTNVTTCNWKNINKLMAVEG